MTFRTFLLGLGFSAFGAYVGCSVVFNSILSWWYSVLAQIYYFKPQTLSVSTLFLLVLSYWFGNALHILLPSKGIFKWFNPGPFNSECHHIYYALYALTRSQSRNMLLSSSCLPLLRLLRLQFK